MKRKPKTQHEAAVAFLASFTPWPGEFTVKDAGTAIGPGWKAPKLAQLKHGKWKTYPNDNDAALDQIRARFPGGVF